MRKVYWLVLVGGGLLLMRRFTPRLEDIDWEKKFADMPETFPPKWMFTNVAAIREQNERILELLTADAARSSGGQEDPPVSA